MPLTPPNMPPTAKDVQMAYRQARARTHPAPRRMSKRHTDADDRIVPHADMDNAAAAMSLRALLETDTSNQIPAGSDQPEEEPEARTVGHAVVKLESPGHDHPDWQPDWADWGRSEESPTDAASHTDHLPRGARLTDATDFELKVFRQPPTLEPHPFSAAHPARQWNKAIHTLPSHLQPIVRWDIRHFSSTNSQETIFVADLTLALPSAHTSLTAHPLRNLLPLNQWAIEYLNCAQALGATRTWAGLPKCSRAEAMTSAVTICMQDHGLEWLAQPVLAPVPMSDGEDVDANTTMGDDSEVEIGDVALSNS